MGMVLIAYFSDSPVYIFSFLPLLFTEGKNIFLSVQQNCLLDLLKAFISLDYRVLMW